MALSTLTYTDNESVSWTAQKNVTGSDYNPISNSSTITKNLSLGTSAANAAVGGADTLASFVTTITASSSASIDLTAVTDILGNASQTFARVKDIVLRLLSATDDSVIGTAASSVTLDNTVTNALSAQSHSGWFDNGSEGAAGGSKFTIPSGCKLAFGMPNAAGVVVDGTHKVVKVVNNDAGLSAKFQSTFCGGST